MPPALATYADLQNDQFRLLIDAGLRSAADALPLVGPGAVGLVAGLETLAGPDVLAELLALVGPARLVFSLDLKNGHPLASAAWSATDPWTIAERALAAGVRRMLVLDLARVGVGGGTGTEALCRRLKESDPALEVLAGGGVRGPDDLQRLRGCGVDGVLVASALHDGRLTRADLG